MGITGRVSLCRTTGFSSTQTTGSLSDRGLSYILSTSSILAMYSSSNFATHHIFFPPRLEVVAFQQDTNGLSTHIGDQFSFDHLFRQQSHRPACPAFWGRRADHRHYPPLLLLVQCRSFARSSGIEQRPLDSSLLIALADLPHGLGGKHQVGCHRRRGLPLIH